MIETIRKIASNGLENSTGRDPLKLALGATGFALAVGYAIHVNNGYYAREALLWLTVGLALLLLSVVLPAPAGKKARSSPFLAWLLGGGIVLETAASVWRARFGNEPLPIMAIAVIAGLGLLQLFEWARAKPVLIVLTVAAFSYCGYFAISLPNPGIDVYDWQQQTSVALTELHDPYLVRIAPRYAHLSYPPGVVDDSGYINCALPYPPLSLLMVVPGFVLGNDIRYSDLFAIAASAVLMAFARPGRIAALAATLFLLTPRVLYVLWNAWTEPLMVFTFSLVMFCACRWRKGMPWALGLFLASKQTAIFALPLVLLLVEGPKLWKQLLWIAVKAGVVVTVINAPFVFWNFHQFVRAVVLLRAVPSFRPDALTYLVWVYSMTGKIPPTWIGVIVGAAAVTLVLWKAPRTPPAFAAGVTLVTALFFAFSKQAFCNYYFLTIGTACWAIAATDLAVEWRFSAVSAPEEMTGAESVIPDDRLSSRT